MSRCYLVIILTASMLCGSPMLNKAAAQLIYQPYSYQFYQKMNDTLYSKYSRLHTAVKPLIISKFGPVSSIYDSLLDLSVDHSRKSWLNHVLFSSHLAEVQNKDYTFYLDYLPDVQVGRDFSGNKSVWLNTRGYQLGGTVGDHFFFYTSGYENQGSFANYEENYIKTIGMIPGEAYNRSIYGLHTDWSYVTAMIGYQVSGWLTVELGDDKTFIGEGYRSALLSDYAAPYPMFRVTADLTKNIRYLAMWAYLEDRTAPQFNSFYNNRRKWGIFHYIEWNISNRTSVGFFNALIAEEANDLGVYHGFDVNYVNPFFLSPSLGPAGKLPDHSLFGFNAKYKILNHTLVYGQLLFDQSPSNGVSHARNAWQVGVRGSELFKIRTLNYLFEYNTARPYTYSAASPIISYANFNEPLGEALGANFRELTGILNYTLGRFDFQGELDYGRYGLNTPATNYGKDLTLPDGVNLPAAAGSTGQGLATTLRYAEGTVAYLLNPKYNLRIEAGSLLRYETNSENRVKTAMLTLGIRSSFRNLYHDF
jgi:hypothetical protein